MRHLLPCAVVVCFACSDAPIINQPPIANPGPERTARPGVEIELSGSASSDPDGSITKYVWDFGDGASGEGVTVRHAWADEGVFAVSLTVTDDQGATNVAPTRVTVSAGGVNMAPTASIDGPSRGMPSERLTFRGGASADPDGTITEHRWDFGDGTTATGSVAAHAFAAAGSFEVSLVVVDDDGAQGRASINVVIMALPANQPPVARAGNDQTVMTGVAVMLDGTGSTDPDGQVASYQWDFGDGAEATTPRVSHTYNRAGMFTARLTVSDDKGATGMDDVTITVMAPPTFDGSWILNPSTASFTCMNPARTYTIAFPAVEMEVRGSTTTDVVARVTNPDMRTLIGAIDRDATPPELSLTFMGSETDATCGTAMVRHIFNAKLPTARTLGEGVYTVIHVWSGDPRCNCAARFEMITGAKR